MTRSECRRRSEPGQSCLPGSHSYVANCSSDNGLHCLPALNGATGSLGNFPQCLTPTPARSSCLRAARQIGPGGRSLAWSSPTPRVVMSSNGSTVALPPTSANRGR